MGKTSLVEAVKQFDLEQVRKDLRKNPELTAVRTDRGFDLLQFCVSRPTWGDRATANRQLRLAKWLVSEGFDPRVIHMTKPGDDGEAHGANPDVPGKDGRTVRDIASRKRDNRCIKAIED